ncbi:ENV2 protein, partial [Crypturellus undulatus]|nr:ENV2 protein [Crypturellus undulatus]
RRVICGTEYENTTSPGAKWAITAEDGWWVCSKNGLTPCLSPAVFQSNKEYCIQVMIVPRILYHPAETMFVYWEMRHQRTKREVLSSLTIAMILGIAGVSTGVSALVIQPSQLAALRAAVDEDIERLEQSISYLEKSLSSLSEVVLQNRRGLDLVFLQQGGVCAALGEECCFYADHTGIVKDSLAKVREGLERRKREREARQGWFEDWYNRSPWLTTMISSFVGPLVVILLILIFGPIILNKLVQLLRGDYVKIMILRQRYE